MTTETIVASFTNANIVAGVGNDLIVLTATFAPGANANLAGHVTSVGNTTSLGSFTVAELNSALSDGSMSSTSHTHSASDIASGTLADARIAETNITQHQAALSVSKSQISDFTETDYATGAEGDLATSALQTSSALGTPVSGIATNLTGTAAGLTVGATTGVEAGADVTDATNVAAAGALMDSEVDANVKTLVLPAATTISAFGASLIDDLNASAAQTTLGVDPSGTDNSTDLTLDAGSLDYLTIVGQVLTRNQVNLTTDVTGVLPIANLATGTPDGTKFLNDAGVLAVPGGSGDALTTNPLSQFAATTSAQVAGVLSDETGTGLLVFGTSPTLITPALGTPSALVGTNITGVASGLTAGNVTTNADLTGDVTSSGNATVIAAGAVDVAMLADGTDGELVTWDSSGEAATVGAGTAAQVLTSNGAGAAPTFQAAAVGTPEGTAILSTGESGGTKFLREDGDGSSSWISIPGGGDALVANPLSQFAATTSAQLASVLSDESGTGLAVFNNSPTLIAPALGTPASGVATNLTGAPTFSVANMTIDDTALVVVDTTNIQTFAEGVDHALLKARSTGVASTYVCSVVVGGTTFDHAAVHGEAYGTAGYFHIIYAGATGISVSDLTATSTYVYVDNAGNLQQQTTKPTREEWTNKMFTMRIAVNTSTNVIVAFEYLSNTIGHYGNTVRDLYKYLLLQGIPLKEGQAITGRADMGFDVGVGSLMELGGTGNLFNPNIKEFSATSNPNYNLMSRTALLSSETDLPVYWDNATTITILGSTTWTAHRVYRFSSGNFAIQYGQSNYANKVLTKAGIVGEEYVLNPSLLDATFMGWWLVESTATATNNLAKAEFVPYTIGATAGAAGANGSDATVTTANVEAAGALMDSEVDADIKTLVLPASTTISAFGASLIDDAAASNARTTLDVDVAGTDNSDNNAANTTYASDYRAANFVAGTHYEAAKGSDDNFVTDAQAVVIGNTSGSNSGDQTLPTDFDPAGTDNSDNNAANTNYANDYRAANFVADTDYASALGADDNYVTDAQAVVIGNTSGTNTGDQTLPTDFDPAGTDNSNDNATNTQYSGLVTNANHSGDVTGSTTLTIAAEAVTHEKLAHVATASVLGRTTAGTGDVETLKIGEDIAPHYGYVDETGSAYTSVDGDLNSFREINTGNPTLHVVANNQALLGSTITLLSSDATERTIVGATSVTLEGKVKINDDEAVTAILKSTNGTVTTWKLIGGGA